jgi:hypothetical protein
MQSQRGFQRLLGHFRAAIEPVMQPCCSSIAAGGLMRPLTSILSLRTYASAEQGALAAAPREHLPPWTPTRLLPKWKALPKRMGHMLQASDQASSHHSPPHPPPPCSPPSSTLRAAAREGARRGGGRAAQVPRLWPGRRARDQAGARRQPAALSRDMGAVPAGPLPWAACRPA